MKRDMSGPHRTDPLVRELTTAQPEIKGQMLEVIPMRRVARPEEMAEAVIWLCLDKASFVTGHIMPVDGGMTST